MIQHCTDIGLIYHFFAEYVGAFIANRHETLGLVRLAIAHQIKHVKSRVAMSKGTGSPIQGQLSQTNKQTNKHKTSLNISNFRFLKKICFREEDSGFLVPK